MTPHDEELIELCASHALGNLESKDRSRFEGHLAKGCPECQAALRDFGDAAMLLAASAPIALPMPHVRGRVLDAVRAIPATIEEPVASRPAVREPRVREARSEAIQERAARPARERRRGMTWVGWVGWGLAALLAVTAGTFFESSGRLRGIIQTREAEIADMAKQLAVEQQWTAILSAPGARVTQMAPPQEGPIAEGPMAGGPPLRGRAILDPGSRRALIVLENALPPANGDYELWAIRGGFPTSLGVVQADPRGVAVVRLDDVGDPATLQSLSVSLEPKGGSPTKGAPTGPMLLAGVL